MPEHIQDYIREALLAKPGAPLIVNPVQSMSFSASFAASILDHPPAPLCRDSRAEAFSRIRCALSMPCACAGEPDEFEIQCAAYRRDAMTIEYAVPHFRQDYSCLFLRGLVGSTAIGFLLIRTGLPLIVRPLQSTGCLHGFRMIRKRIAFSQL